MNHLEEYKDIFNNIKKNFSSNYIYVKIYINNNNIKYNY